MASMIDPVHFKDLAAKDTETLVLRTGAVWDSSSRQYRLKVWGNMYLIDVENGRILAEESPMQEYMDLFILHYLLNGKSIPLANEWVSEKDIPGGSAFFRGPHTLPTQRIARAFGRDMEGFSKACQDLGGQPLSMADAAFVFEITPSIPVAVLLWLGDEDFDAEAKLLFDKTIARQLPLDIIYALAVLVCKTIC